MPVLGCQSHVGHLAGHLLEMQLDVPAGAILKKAMEGMGIQVHLKKLTSEVKGSDRVEGLAFKDDTSLDCDMVIVAAGIRPNSEIGVRAGLTVERAIVVDNHMRSVDDPDVYVVGECAQHRGRVYGLVAPLWDQGKVFADHITEKNTSSVYLGSKLATKLKVMGIELASMGATSARPHISCKPSTGTRRFRKSVCRCCSISEPRAPRSRSMRCRPTRKSAIATASPKARSAPVSPRANAVPKP